MAEKKGAGGKPQTYDESSGRYVADYAAFGTQELRERQIIEIPEVKQKLYLPDETIPRSLSAKWANEDIAMPDGAVAHFVEGTKLHHIEVFAGKGTRTPIRDVERLVSTYGGKAEDWQKVKGIGTIEVNGKSSRGSPLVSRADHREERIKSEDMKVRIIPEQRKIAGEFYTGDILDDKIYDAELVEGEIPMYRIVDESGEAYGYFVEMFEIVEE